MTVQQGEWGRIGMLEPQCAVPVEPDALDPRNYTLSLLEACREKGLLDDAQCGRIQLGLGRIFAETAAEYTRRASSTIPRTTARQLYDAVLFRCDAYLSRLPLSEGIHLLQQGNMEEICHRGMECILDAFTRCKEIFRQAYAIRCRLPIGAYQYAMEHAFDRFCKGYSARFDPRNDCMGIDYPLLGRQAYALPEEGVWFVGTYYSCLLLENQLCRMVPASALAALFAGYARSYHCEPEDLHISAAELLVNQLLTGMLLGAAPLQVLFTERSQLLGMLKPDVPSLQAAFHRRYESIMSPPLLAYAEAYIPRFVWEWSIRDGYQGLANWLVLP